MFGRSGSKPEQVTPAPKPGADAAGRNGAKGRPTPTRREAEQRNRRPVVAGGRVPDIKPNATKAERKAAVEANRRAMKADRARTRQAMLEGDERYYLPRDQGPARRWARDYVDSRHNLGEYFLFFTIGILLLSSIRVPGMNVIFVLVLYAGGIALMVDLYLIRRRVLAECTKRFGAEESRRIGGYAMQRSLNMRRLRLPRPQVKRGERPV